MPQLEIETAHVIAASVLHKLGTPRDIADQVATWLVRSDQSGHPSHGIIRLKDYANRIRTGELAPGGRPSIRTGAEGGSSVLIDGHGGYGMIPAAMLVDIVVERAQVHTIALGGIVNAGHTGRLGEWAERAAEKSTILLMCTASMDKTNVAAFGAREGRLGTNPMACAVPARDGDAFMLDFATSSIAGGKIQHLISTNEQAPPESLIDRHGMPTTNPRDWLDGGLLTTFGGHKGYGLALLVSLLSGCVVRQAEPGSSAHGVMMIAIKPGAFAPADLVLASVAEQLSNMRDTPPRDGFDRVEVPGDFERRNRERQARRVDVPDATWRAILAMAEELGVPKPASADA